MNDKLNFRKPTYVDITNRHWIFHEFNYRFHAGSMSNQKSKKTKTKQ